VHGTRRILEFCSTDSRKTLHFLSTIGVLATGNTNLPRRPERDAIEPDAKLEIGYEQSKWVSDRLVGMARQQGLSAWTYRVGFVGGLSVNGAFLRTNEFFPSFLRGCVELGAYPAMEHRMAAVPVDWVADVISSRIGREEAGRGVDLHLIHPAPLSITACFEALRERGHALEGLSFADWKRRLYTEPPGRLRQLALFDYLEFLRPLEERHFAAPPIDFEESTTMWQEHPCPDARSLLDTCVQTMVERGEFPPPRA
jgi:thioester reductase-like protein